MAPTTYTAILSHLTYFLTVAIHTILAERNCYPAHSFTTTRAYNLPIRQSRHPDVCAWIQSAVAAVRTELLKGTVARVVLALAHPTTSEILERYVFDLTKLPTVPREEVDTAIIWGDDPSEGRDGGNARDGGDGDGDLYGVGDAEGQKRDLDPRGPGGAREHELVDLTEQLRATLASISVSRRRLKPIPEGCPFTVAIELKEGAEAPIGHPQPWVPVQPNVQRLKRKQGGQDDDGEGSDGSGGGERMGRGLGGQRTIPVRSVEGEGVAFELWVEEGRAKRVLDGGGR